MDHLRFKSEQTAAAYVADGLDPDTREQFELHLMACPECVEDVEGWRAIKHCLPGDTRSASGAVPEAARLQPIGRAISVAVPSAAAPTAGAPGPAAP
ncbi:MAG: zf-HC2 domain-containing protein, partial [Steroidobacteraceae bacterium]